jgi:hypothetical protein
MGWRNARTGISWMFVVRTLLIESSVHPRFWVEALSTAVYLINRLPSQVLDLESPYFRLHQKHPSYSSLRPFGCVCFVFFPRSERNKLSAQSSRCVFLGYSTTQIRRGMSALILSPIKYGCLEMWFSLRINISIQRLQIIGTPM